MYEEFALGHYKPLLDIIDAHGVDIKICRTYANSRILIPSLLKFGINGLWACETNIDSMDYVSLRDEFGRDLRLIGGIDLDALRSGREAIEKEISRKVPPLLKQGGYIPLADGRIRKDISFSNYSYYRSMLEKLISGSSLN
jgi:uroporphyrinogen decarboxylase